MRTLFTRMGILCMLIAGCNGEIGGSSDIGTGGDPSGDEARRRHGFGGGVSGQGGSGNGGDMVVLGMGGSTGAAGSGTAGTGGATTAGMGGATTAGMGGATTRGTGGATTAGMGGVTTAGMGGATTRGTGGATAPGMGGTTGGSAGTTSTVTIVPLYTDPSDSSWTAIVSAKLAHPTVPVIAILNPDNGPGASRNTSYASGIAKLQQAGIVVIGYVATGYTDRGIPAVEADIDHWKSFYPSTQGIFFDEQSNTAGHETFYRTVSQYSKAQGLSFTVGNPGTDTGPSYIGAVDVGLIYESFGLPGTSVLTGWHSSYPKSNFGIIPYGAALDHAYVKAAKALVGYIYVTNDDLPNPWDSLPSYFADLLADLE